MGGVVKATKRFGMVTAIIALGMAMTACASGKTIDQGNEELSIDESKYHEALKLQDDGAYFKSMRAWEEVLSDEPKFAAGHFNLGLINDKLNLVDEAIPHYELAVQMLENSLEVDDDPEETKKESQASLAMYNLHLGAAYLRDARIEEGEVTLMKALELDPYNPTIHYNLAACFMSQKHFDLGLLHADQAVDLYAKPDSKNNNRLAAEVDALRLGKYLLRQAQCHLAMEEWDKAEVCLNRAKTQCRIDVPAALWTELDEGKNPKKPNFDAPPEGTDGDEGDGEDMGEGAGEGTEEGEPTGE